MTHRLKRRLTWIPIVVAALTIGAPTASAVPLDPGDGTTRLYSPTRTVQSNPAAPAKKKKAKKKVKRVVRTDRGTTRPCPPGHRSPQLVSPGCRKGDG